MSLETSPGCVRKLVGGGGGDVNSNGLASDPEEQAFSFTTHAFLI